MNSNVKVLIIEDNNADCQLVTEYLTNSKNNIYNITDVQSLEKGIIKLQEKQFDIILLDLNLPDSKGIDTYYKLREKSNIPIIILTSNQDYQLSIETIKKGAEDYINKNNLSTYLLEKSIIYTLERIEYRNKFEESESNVTQLLEASSDAIYVLDKDYRYVVINSAGLRMINKRKDEVINKKITSIFPGIEQSAFFKMYKEVMETRQSNYFSDHFTINGHENYYEVKVDPSKNGILCFARDITERREEEIKLVESMIHLEKSVVTTLEVLANMVELKDPYTAGHQKICAELSKEIAIELGMDNEQIEGVFMAASIHDIGKISIPSSILSKPTSLNYNEIVLVREHTILGCELVKKIDTKWPLCEVILQHHERIDGSGYPHGIKGDKISIEAKIVAVADVIEAMNAHRPYRPSLGMEAALHEINNHVGTLFDKDVVNACNKVIEKGLISFKNS